MFNPQEVKSNLQPYRSRWYGFTNATFESNDGLLKGAKLSHIGLNYRFECSKAMKIIYG